MATVFREQGGGLPASDYEGRGQLTPYVFVVEGHSVNEDPRTVTGTDGTTPYRINATIVVGSKTYTCDRVECTRSIRDDATEVSCYFSTDRRFGYPNRQDNPDEQGYYNWDLSFQLSSETVPGWKRADGASSTGGGSVSVVQEWVDDEYTTPTSLMVFSVQVRIDDITPGDLENIIETTVNAAGQIHILPMFNRPPEWNTAALRALFPQFTGNVFEIPGNGRVWVLQEPALSGPGINPDTETTHTFITYTWLSDRGTWNALGGGLTPAQAAKFSFAPPRPPWHRYHKIPQSINAAGDPDSPEWLGHPAGAPAITVMPNIVLDDTNPYFVPNGYQTLPGNPI